MKKIINQHVEVKGDITAKSYGGAIRVNEEIKESKSGTYFDCWFRGVTLDQGQFNLYNCVGEIVVGENATVRAYNCPQLHAQTEYPEHLFVNGEAIIYDANSTSEYINRERPNGLVGEEITALEQYNDMYKYFVVWGSFGGETAMQIVAVEDGAVDLSKFDKITKIVGVSK